MNSTILAPKAPERPTNHVKKHMNHCCFLPRARKVAFGWILCEFHTFPWKSWIPLFSWNSIKWWDLWFSWPKVVPFAAEAVGLTIYKWIHSYSHALLGLIMEFLTKTAESAPFMILWWFHGNQWISWKIMKMMGNHRNELPRSCEIVQ